MDKSEKVEGQESLHTAGGPTGYLCSATVYMKLDLSRSTWIGISSANCICYEFCIMLEEATT